MRDKKSLIIYFSRADENYNVGYVDKGNTEIVAEYVQQVLQADIFKVEPLIPYAKDYHTCINEAKARIGKAQIKSYITDVSPYEVIYIMTPIYWGTYAPELETALRYIDFTGKTIRIITTHEGSGLGNVVEDVKKVCPGAIVLDNALALVGSKVKESKSIIDSWL